MGVKLLRRRPSLVRPAFSRLPPVRAASVVMLAGALVLLGQSTGFAGIGWCRSDPLVLIDGIPADVFASVHLDDLLHVSGPTEFVIAVPKGVDTLLLLSGIGFGYGEVVSFEESGNLKATATGIEVRVDVFVPSRGGSLPVRVEFAPRIIGILAPASVEGTTNTWITLRTTL